MIHNHSALSQIIEVEILAAEGEPEVQTLRIYAESSIQPHHPLDVELDRSGTVESLGQLLDDSVILWIGLAWPDSASGPHPVQVTLRSEEGVTLTSTVVRTTLASGMQPESMGHRMSDAASEVRRIALSLAD